MIGDSITVGVHRRRSRTGTGELGFDDPLIEARGRQADRRVVASNPSGVKVAELHHGRRR